MELNRDEEDEDGEVVGEENDDGATFAASQNAMRQLVVSPKSA